MPDPPSTEEVDGLRRWNLVALVLHAASAIGVIAIANDFSLPVNASYPQAQPGVQDTWPAEVLFDVPLAWAAAGFAILSALAHLAVVTGGWRRYRADLADRGINQLRWIEYALSSSLMIFLIAQLVGIYDVAALLSLVGCNAAMILFGWSLELHAADRRRLGEAAPMSHFWFGCIAGIIPWIAIGIYLFGSGDAPTFVYGIYASLFVFFNTFGIVAWLEYRAIGPWRRVLVAERTYIVLSLTAKLALTWQVAANVLVL